MPRGEMTAADTGLDGIEADDPDDELGESARLCRRRPTAAVVHAPSDDATPPKDRP